MAPSQKTMLFVCMLVVAVAVIVPVAQGIHIKPVITIPGTVLCKANASAPHIGNIPIPIPPFRNATVQLRCGPGNGTLLASAHTNSTGGFTIVVPVTGDGALLRKIISLLTECRLVVATPLTSCNPNLPGIGHLTARLLAAVLTIINGVLGAQITIGNFTLI